jgi:hypothetical protein
MSEQAAQQQVQGMLDQASAMIDEAIKGVQLTSDEARRISEHARMRIREAGMLLNLATGKAEPIHYSLGALMRAVTQADDNAKRIMNADISLEGKTEQEYVDIMNMLELAHAGYNQWRCLSSLALMHLSDSLIKMQQAASK